MALRKCKQEKLRPAKEVVHRQRQGIAGKTILPPLQPNWTNLLTHVFIYIIKSMEKRTPTPEIDLSLLIRLN